MTDRALRVAAKGDFIDAIDGEAVGAIIGGAALFATAIVAVLRDGDFAGNRGVEDLALVVDKGRPGVVSGELVALREALLDRGLQRVIAGAASIGAQAQNATAVIDTLCSTRAGDGGVAIDALKKRRALSGDVADVRCKTADKFALDLYTILLCERRTEGIVDQRTRNRHQVRRQRSGPATADSVDHLKGLRRTCRTR